MKTNQEINNWLVRAISRKNLVAGYPAEHHSVRVQSCHIAALWLC